MALPIEPNKSTSNEMPYLFRAYSDSSNGLNSRTIIAPQAANFTVNTYVPPTFSASMGQALKLAISSKKTPEDKPNPFVFFTPSLLLALQFAHYRDAQKQTNIHITCFDAGQVRTPSGQRVRFTCVGEMIKTSEIKVLDRDKKPRIYAAEYATLDCVMLGDKARTASLQELKSAGLYKLYPTIKLANEARGNRSSVNMELDLIRGMYFLEDSTIRPCGIARIDMAAKLAAIFRPNGQGKEKIAEHLLAWFLSLQKRDTSGQTVISWWLTTNSSPRTTRTDHSPGFAFAIDMTTMPEVSQFHKLWTIIRNHAIADQALLAKPEIRSKLIEEEIMEWRVYRDMAREKHREMCQESRAAGGGKPHKSRGGAKVCGRPDYQRRDRVQTGRVERRGSYRKNRFPSSSGPEEK